MHASNERVTFEDMHMKISSDYCGMTDIKRAYKINQGIKAFFPNIHMDLCFLHNVFHRLLNNTIMSTPTCVMSAAIDTMHF